MSPPARAAAGLLLLLAGSCRPATEAIPAETTVPSSGQGTTIRGSAPRATGGFPSVVMLAPATDQELPPASGPARLDQFNTAFHPRVLLVRVGQVVQFKNSEDTLHNVHVIDRETRETAFNVATPVRGSYDHVFDQPAVYDVSCGIHPSMAAFVVVTETPYAAVADNDGLFTLDGVPPGDYVATVWNLAPDRRRQRRITVESPAKELRFDEIS